MPAVCVVQVSLSNKNVHLLVYTMHCGVLYQSLKTNRLLYKDWDTMRQEAMLGPEFGCFY